MNTKARPLYFKRYWPAACQANGWKPTDNDRRRQVTAACMSAIGGPAVSTSAPEWGENETSALFCYLDHLGHPASLEKSAAWVDCQTDYIAWNRARQADWHEAETYGEAAGKTRLDRDRFGGESTAVNAPLEAFDPVKARQRHLTMRNRHAAKKRRARIATPDPF